MKTSEQFKEDIYRKRAAHWKRRRRTAVGAILLCVPLAAAAVWGAGYLAEHPGGLLPLLPARIAYPHSTQVLESKQPQDLSTTAIDDRYDRGSRQWDQQQEKTQAERRENVLDPSFPQAVNAFAGDCAALLSEEFEENDCYSPLSLYMALSLAGSGARGETGQEFLDLLHQDDMDFLQEQCGRFYRLHYRDSEACRFQLANSLWLDERTEFEPEFLSGAQEQFYASLFQADFTDPGTGKDMGTWIAQNTNGLLAPELDTDPEERLAILNTVYFRARWWDDFYEEDNTQEPFHREDGSSVECTFLNRSWDTGTGLQGDGFRRASLSFQGGYEMLFVLPDEGVTPRELLQDPNAFEAMFLSPEKEQEYEIHWSIPKFSFDTEYDLMDTLAGLGLDTALNLQKADFSGISPEQLFLSSATQGVHIEVNEDGVEAAGYTALGISGTSAAPPSDVLEMKLDRPFLFAVRSDSLSAGGTEIPGTLLFVGVCGDPSAG